MAFVLLQGFALLCPRVSGLLLQFIFVPLHVVVKLYCAY